MLNSNLNAGEHIIWSHAVQKDAKNNETTEKWLITNLRAIKAYPTTKDNPQGKFTAIGWLDLSNSIVINQIHKFKGTHVGLFEGPSREEKLSSTTAGINSSVSKSFGDLVFLHNDKEIFRFQGISDPNNINRRVKNLKKEYSNQVTVQILSTRMQTHNKQARKP